MDVTMLQKPIPLFTGQYQPATLNPQALQLINNILFLQVTTLSELSNQTGMQVLQQYLQSPNLNSIFPQIYPHPGSTLRWPTQTLPGPKAWKVWHKTVTNLYCHMSPTKLLQPMGEWINATYNLYWVWAWYICIPTNTLYQQNDNQWNKYTPMTNCSAYMLFQMPPDNTKFDLPMHTMQVTPTFTWQGKLIDLPAVPIQKIFTSAPEHPILWIH